MKKAAKKSTKRASKPSKKSPKTSFKPKRKIRSLLKKARLFFEPVLAPEKKALEQGVAPSPAYQLPTSYHEDKLTLLVRDPWWLYAFWEVTPDRERAVLDEISRRGQSRELTVLRVYEITGADPSRPNSFFDIELHFFTTNWYVDVGRPDSDWFAEIGIRTTNGSFFALVRSNVVRTPRFGISDVLDEEWLMPDEFYWKLFGYASGLGSPASSLEARATVERYLQSVAGELSSFTGGPSAPKFDIGPIPEK